MANRPDELWYRIAKRCHDPLSAPMRAYGSAPDAGGRFDTPGSTLYVARHSSTAFAEVLSPFKRAVGGVDPLESDASAVGLKRDEFLEVVATEWQEFAFMGVGAVPAAWRHDRALLEICVAGAGWWVDIEHPDSLAAAEILAEEVLVGHGVKSLTTSVLRSERRAVTTGVAAALRHAIAQSRHPVRGIQFGSKFGGGACRAVWLPANGDLGPATQRVAGSQPILVSNEDLILTADRFRIRVF